MAYIETSLQQHVLFITLNRPEKFNSFCREMALALQDALDQAGQDDTIRCVLITGTGKAFCAGQDLAEAIEDNGLMLEQIVREHYNPIIEKMRRLMKPVVCAVNGVAAGAGANIALAGDIVVACAGASFIQAFSKIGLIPDSGGTFFLPRLIGMQKATAYMMLGDKIAAAEAERCGMIYRCIPDETFEEESRQLAIRLAQMPTQGLAYTKCLLNETYQHTLSQQLDAERMYQVKAGDTADYREGVQAFLEKRAPTFSGH